MRLSYDRHRELMDTLQAFIKDSTMPLELQKSLESYFIQCRCVSKPASELSAFEILLVSIVGNCGKSGGLPVC